MKRTATIVLISLAVLIVALGVFFASILVWDALDGVRASRELHQKTAYWRSTLEREVSLGEPQGDVQRWIRRRFAAESPSATEFDPYTHAFYLNAGSVRAGGLGIPCGSYSIMLRIDVGADGRVSKRTVSNVGECL